MNRIDKLCTDLIDTNRITLTEALAIGASVRFVTQLEGKTQQEFITRYGREARDKAFSWLQPVEVPITKEAKAAHHSAQIRQQQMDGA